MLAQDHQELGIWTGQQVLTLPHSTMQHMRQQEHLIATRTLEEKWHGWQGRPIPGIQDMIKQPKEAHETTRWILHQNKVVESKAPFVDFCILCGSTIQPLVSDPRVWTGGAPHWVERVHECEDMHVCAAIVIPYNIAINFSHLAPLAGAHPAKLIDATMARKVVAFSEPFPIRPHLN